MTVFTIASINANGLQGKNRFRAFMKSISRWTKKGKASVYLVQEHNFDPATISDRERLASYHNFKLVASCADQKIKTNGSVHYIYYGGLKNPT